MNRIDIPGTAVAWSSDAYGVRFGHVKGRSPDGRVILVELLGEVPDGLQREVYTLRRQLKAIR